MTEPAPTVTFTRGRMLRGSAALMVGSAAVTLVGFASVVVVAHHISVSSFGVYSFAIAYSSFVALFTSLGLDAVTTRELSGSSPEAEGTIIGSALVVKAVVLAVVMAVSVASLFFFGPAYRVAGLVAVSVLVTGIPGTLALSLTTRLRMVSITMLQLAGAMAGLIGTLAVIIAHRGVLAMVSVQCASAVGGALATAWYARRFRTGRLHVDWPTVRHLARGTAPLAVSVVAVMVYRRADQLMLGSMRSAADLARYAASVRLVDGLNLVPTAVAAVALPVLSRRPGGADDRPLTEAGFRYLAAIILPLAALGTVAGRPALQLTFGTQYRGGAGMLAVLLWAHFFGFAGLLWSQVLVARNQVRYMAAFNVTAAVVNVGLNVWLIPAYAGLGAAWASLAAYAVPSVIGLAMPGTRRLFVRCYVSSVRPALAAAVVFVALLAVHPSVGLLLPFFAVVTVVTLVVTRAVPLPEVRRLVRHLVDRARPERREVLPSWPAA